MPRELWLRIAQRVEEILAGRQARFPEPETVEQHAQRLARQLRAKGVGLSEKPDPAVVRVDLDSMEHQDPVSVGAERVCLQALEDLGFQRILKGCALSLRDARIATAIVAARMIHPSSEREASRWLQCDSALPELLGLEADQRALSRKTLYRVCYLLWKHRKALQQGLRQQESALFGIPEAIVLYDLTNAHCCGLADGALRRRGRSKQRRNDCPLVTTALMLDSAGFPRACEILPGNVSECGTLADAIARLREECSLDQPKPTVVMDAGIATEANLAWLREQGYGWICVNRGKRPAPPKGEPDLDLVTASKQTLQAWSLGVEDGELRLYVRSEAKKQKEDAILSAKRKRFEAELFSLHEGLTVPGRTKKYERILERVGRIRKRYTKVSGQYDIHVDRDPGTDKKRPGPNAKAVRFTSRPSLEQADASAGAYLLRTSRLDWNLQDIVEQSPASADHGSRGRVPLPEERTRPAPHLAPGRQPDPRPPLHRRPRDPHPPETGRKQPLLGVHPKPAAKLGPHHNHHPGGRRRPDRLSAGCSALGRGRGNRPADRRQARQPPAHQPAKRLTKSAHM